MHTGATRDTVIANIQQALADQSYHRKTQPGDPTLTEVEKKEIVTHYLNRLHTSSYRLSHATAVSILYVAAYAKNRSTKIIGAEKIAGVQPGAIITSNHFNPLDATVIYTMENRLRNGKLKIVGQETNLAMDGIVGFLMRNIGLIPVSSDPTYMAEQFPALLQTVLAQQYDVLIYPEQEMWYNYRKPRPLKRGAYYYAAQLQVPILSCFTEIRDVKNEPPTPSVDSTVDGTADGTAGAPSKTQYILHILDPIYPDPQKDVRTNSKEMCRIDYLQKKEAYETAYQKPLEYTFEAADIAR